MKKVTVLGGGTGTFVVLSGLKKFSVDLGVVVNMMDSGGSTGRLRDQLGVLPPGDLRQCLVALSEAPEMWRQLFLYRFDHGDLKGHNFGNIFLTALEKLCPNYDDVLETVAFVLKIKGDVIPITYEKSHLCVEYENGNIVKGEGNIDENIEETSRIKKAYLEPNVAANPKAITQIETSDYLIIGPGDLYTSIIPIFLTEGMKEAVQRSNAKIIYISNLMTKHGQTTNYTAADHIADIKRYVGREPDMVLLNNGSIPSEALAWYHDHNEELVANNLRHMGYDKTIVEDDLIDRHTVQQNHADELTRSILRHDSDRLASVISQVIGL